jgi:hypothetical protein
MLMRDADNLTDQLPASLLGLRSSLNEHLVNTAELKKRLDVAEQRSRLDSSRVSYLFDCKK